MATRAARQQPRTQRNKKKKRAGRSGLVLGAAVMLFVVVYCILCGVAGSGDTLRKGTSVNGVEIGGLTRDEAVAALEEGLAGVTAVEGVDYAAVEVVPEVEGVQPYTVDLSAALGYDAERAVDQAYAYDHGGFFLGRGIRYLATLSGGKAYTILPHAADAAQVTAALEASGLLGLNTTVQTSYALTEATLDFTVGTSGVSVDEEALVQQIMENTAKGDYSAITCPLVSSAPDPVDLQAVYEAVFTEPVNATLDVAADHSYTIVDSVPGISFDVAQAQEMLSAAQEGTVVSVPLNRADPAIDTATLKAGLFRDVLGEYSTNVSGTSARRSNVKLSGEKCSGVILLPGETFAYNEVVGQRTAEAGFQEAAAYLNGETIQELGGGVCQTSSTLYCACLYANLEIVERYNHTYVSSYVPLGMDATVSWGGPDYKFKNNTDYPIKIVAAYSNNKLTFQILGTKVSDFEVKITSQTLAVIEPEVKEVPDATMLVGTTAVEDKGHTGYKVQTYRHVYDGNGNLISEGDEAYSAYRKTDKVVRVGTKEPEVPAVNPENPEVPVMPTEPEGGTGG